MEVLDEAQLGMEPQTAQYREQAEEMLSDWREIQKTSKACLFPYTGFSMCHYSGQVFSMYTPVSRGPFLAQTSSSVNPILNVWES